MDNELREIDDLIYTNLEEIKRRIGVVNYSKIETLIKGMLSVAESCGEKIYRERLEANQRTNEKAEKERKAKEEVALSKRGKIIEAHILRKQEMTYEQIAKELGVAKATVCNFIVHYHVTNERMEEYINASKS